MSNPHFAQVRADQIPNILLDSYNDQILPFDSCDLGPKAFGELTITPVSTSETGCISLNASTTRIWDYRADAVRATYTGDDDNTYGAQTYTPLSEDGTKIGLRTIMPVKINRIEAAEFGALEPFDSNASLPSRFHPFARRKEREYRAYRNNADRMPYMQESFEIVPIQTEEGVEILRGVMKRHASGKVIMIAQRNIEENAQEEARQLANPTIRYSHNRVSA